MTGLASGSRDAQGRLGRSSARMVLTVDFSLEGTVADLLRSELDHGVTVHVVLLRPRLGWSTAAVLVAPHRRRIAAARSNRLEERGYIAGARHKQVTASTQRHRWRAAAPSRSPARYVTSRPDQKEPSSDERHRHACLGLIPLARGSANGPSKVPLVVTHDQIEKLTEGDTGFQLVTEVGSADHLIAVAATHLLLAQVPPPHQISHDLLHCALSNPDRVRYITHPGVRVQCQ